MRKSVAALIAASALSGCQVHAQEDAGRTVSRNYQVGNFQQIEVAGPYDVDVRTGSNVSVSAKGGEKLLTGRRWKSTATSWSSARSATTASSISAGAIMARRA